MLFSITIYSLKLFINNQIFCILIFQTRILFKSYFKLLFCITNSTGEIFIIRFFSKNFIY
jgi:hypothetical protein